MQDKKEHIKKNNEIRISAAALCRIKIDNKFLLILNKSHLEKGKLVYMPLGGHIKVNYNGRNYLIEEFNARFLEDSNDNVSYDLNIVIKKNMLKDFNNWFELGYGRETTPLRELKEELVDEMGIVDSLKGRDTQSKYSFRISQIDRSKKYIGQTKRYFEFHDVGLGIDLEDKIKDAADESYLIALVTEEEIGNGRINDQEMNLNKYRQYKEMVGIRELNEILIGPTAKYLLDKNNIHIKK